MHFLPQDGEGPTVARKLACGALAGSIAQTVTYPLGKYPTILVATYVMM
jgi:hypothetical protein